MIQGLNPKVHSPPFATTAVASALATALPGRPGLQTLGLRDSLNLYTIFTQPPYSFSACLASKGVVTVVTVVYLLHQGHPRSEIKQGQIHHRHCH